MNEAIGVASQFVGDGIVYQSDRRVGHDKGRAGPRRAACTTDGPLVVLADGSSASSAEIVTGAIQDAGRGTVVGEKTFGTGTVLGRFDLTDGSSMRIGVERWLTRGGRPIWHEGLEPDVKVVAADRREPLRPDDLRDITAAELAKATDTQVLKALAGAQGQGLTSAQRSRVRPGRPVRNRNDRRRCRRSSACRVGGAALAAAASPPRGGSNRRSARRATPSCRPSHRRR